VDVFFAQGQTLLRAGAAGAVWRIRQGLVCLERAGCEGQQVLLLAGPGDLVGVEALCAEPVSGTVTALLDSVACLEPLTGEAARMATLAAGFVQQQRQALDMALLRSGPVAERLRHLLALLGRRAGGRQVTLERKALPSLKDMAQIVASTPETVCRSLKLLLPGQPRQQPAPVRPLWHGTTPFAPIFTPVFAPAR
jgi:CRP-like cAMP-binding protein